MFDVEIYENAAGRSEIAEWLEELNRKAHTSKESRVRLKKIAEYIELLKTYGTQDRIMFAYWRDNKFILLSHFVKKTQKTPAREIEKAERLLADFLERSG